MNRLATLSVFAALSAGCQLEQKGPLFSLRVSGTDALVDVQGSGSPASEAANDEDPDGDGLALDTDDCPWEAEDFDEHRDLDGCPEPDNDNDGLLDADDACPLETESQSQSTDRDGCPDIRLPDVCTPAGPPGEVCNGLDEDCDGRFDEDFIGTGALGCYDEAYGIRGRCGRLGVLSCFAPDVEVCLGVGVPRPETCNGDDDDCDGEADEECRELPK